MPLPATAASQSLPSICLMRMLRTVGLVMQCIVTAPDGEGGGGGLAAGAERTCGQQCVRPPQLPPGPAAQRLPPPSAA